MGLLGNEMISGFKGGESTNLGGLRFDTKGELKSAPGGEQFPYGIWKQKSPDGEHYRDLKEPTVKFKIKGGSPTPRMALLNMHRLVNALYKQVYGTRSVALFFKGGYAEKSRRLELEGGVNWQSTNLANRRGGFRRVHTDPIPHRDIQAMVREKLRGIITVWVRRFI